MRKIICLIFLFIGMLGHSQKQTLKPSCGTDQLMNSLIKENPDIQNRINGMNAAIKESRKKGAANRVTAGKLTIPVVVYVIHDGTAAVNISDTQVQSQITALNTNFSDYGLEFCLATRVASTTSIPVPTGGIQAVPGIIHLQSSMTNHVMNQQGQTTLVNNTTLSTVSGDKFLRIWVVKSISDGAGSTGIAGYSLYPGTSPTFDGIVMRYDVFGDVTNCSGCNLIASNNLGRVLVHEVGHYLNLYHTFQGGCSGNDTASCEDEGDLVCDTPQVSSANSGCPVNINSCGTDIPDDINNFMDYTNDVCRTEFTAGQKERMFETLNLYRRKLFSPDNLIDAGVCGYATILSATFTPSTYQPCTGTAVTFTPLVANAANTTYAWNFGDAVFSTSTTAVSHTYTSATGSPFTATLTLTRNGESTVYTTQIYVTACSPILNGKSNWYLSSTNGLKFGTGVPVVDNSMPEENFISRGCAVQSSTTGAVLFYTNSIKVWKADHTVLNTTAGTAVDLKGNYWGLDGVIIVPNPSNSASYYIFTKGTVGITNNNLLDGLRSTVITMSGSVPTMPAATVNVPITALTGMTGFLAGNDNAVYGGTSMVAFQHCGGYYIFTTLKKSDGYYLTVFSLTTAGLSYKSSILLPNNHISDKMHISPNGNKIAYISWGTGNNDRSNLLFDFDKYSGIISNPQTFFEVSNYTWIEGVEFSPDSRLMYTSDVDSAFYQIDISAANPLVSRKIISTEFTPRALKRGPDGKIYYIDAPYIDNYRMGVIHKPNLLVTDSNTNACEFTPNGPLFPNVLVSNYVELALPSTISGVASSSVSVYATACQTYKFFPNVSPALCFSSFRWDFGDVNSGTTNNASTVTTPTHVFSAPGTYTVKVYSSTNVFVAQTTVTIDPITALEIFGDATACLTRNHLTYNSVNIPEGNTVVWTATGGNIAGANNQPEVTVNWTSLPGTLTLTLTNAGGCTAISTKTISAFCNETGANDVVNTTNLQSNGGIIFGGDFTAYNDTPINRIARLNTDMSLDTSFTVGTGANGSVLTSAIQTDGKIIIGGTFTTYNGIARDGIARLNSNGTLDTTFAIGTGFNGTNSINAVVVQSDGKIVVGGSFTSYNGVSRINLIRLNTNGTLDTTFASITDLSSVYCLGIQTDGKILVGSFGGGIRRLTSGGGNDTSFVTGTNFTTTTNAIGSAVSLKIQTDGKILVGGDFAKYNGVTRKFLARLNTNGGLDLTFVPDLIYITGNGGTPLRTIDVQTDNKIVIGGTFMNISSSYSRKGIARLNASGTLDLSFDPVDGFSYPSDGRGSKVGTVNSLNIQPDGKIVTGGSFTFYNQISANFMTRISTVLPGAMNKMASEVIGKDDNIMVYPNPALAYFTIATSGIEADFVEIYNTLGQIVKTQKMSNGRNDVYIEDFASGIYYLKIYNKGNLLKSDKISKK